MVVVDVCQEIEVLGSAVPLLQTSQGVELDHVVG